MKKPLSLILALLMLCAVLVGCNDTPDDSDDTHRETLGDSSGGVDANGYELDDLPELSYDGKDVRVLTWTQPYLLEFYEETSSNIVQKALFARMINVQDRLDCVFNIHQESGTGSASDETAWMQHIDNNINAGEDGYDIISQYSSFGMLSTLKGQYYNMMNYDYLNFDKPWWPEDLMNCLNIGGAVYFVSGDISVGRTTGLFGILVNNDMVEDYRVEEDIYQLASEGKWTLEKMMNISKLVYTDIDASGTNTNLDEYGFVFTNDVSMDAFLEGSGIQIVKKKADGTLSIGAEFGGQKTSDLIQLMGNFVSQDSTFINTSYGDIFPYGRAMFMVSKIDFLATHNDRFDFSYGALPIPKYDEDQEDYRTTVNFNYTMYSIPKTAQDPNMMSAVLEALASEGYRTVTPAVFESAFKLRYSEAPEISEMFDLIRNGTSFDLGRITYQTFEADGLTPMPYAFRSLAATGIGWGSAIRKNKDAWTAELDSISKKLAAETLSQAG